LCRYCCQRGRYQRGYAVRAAPAGSRPHDQNKLDFIRPDQTRELDTGLLIPLVPFLYVLTGGDLW
jgi:hypothetical protein